MHPVFCRILPYKHEHWYKRPMGLSHSVYLDIFILRWRFLLLLQFAVLLSVSVFLFLFVNHFANSLIECLFFNVHNAPTLFRNRQKKYLTFLENGLRSLTFLEHGLRSLTFLEHGLRSLTFLEHGLRSLTFLEHGLRSLAFCVMVCRSLSFCTFSVGHCIVWILLRFTASDYSFGIFKIVLQFLVHCLVFRIITC